MLIRLQNMEKTFKEMGYKTQVKTLTDFYDDYGLEGGEHDSEEDEDEDEDMSDEEDGSSDDEGSDSDEDMEK